MPVSLSGGATPRARRAEQRGMGNTTPLQCRLVFPQPGDDVLTIDASL
jgi:hypothetical protein